MGFGNFALRIKSLVNFETFEKPPCDQKQASRFSVVRDEIVKKNSSKK